jgi:hypothetical protein
MNNVIRFRCSKKPHKPLIHKGLGGYVFSYAGVPPYPIHTQGEHPLYEIHINNENKYINRLARGFVCGAGGFV